MLLCIDHLIDVFYVITRWVQSQAKKDDADEAIAKYDGMLCVCACFFL